MNTENTETETGEGNAPRIDWQTWMSCLSQARIDKIAFKTGFKTSDGMLHPEHSAVFNNAVNVARARKLGFV